MTDQEELIEKLRQKYKREALQAIERATISAEERGHERAKHEFEEEVQRLRQSLHSADSAVNNRESISKDEKNQLMKNTLEIAYKSLKVSFTNTFRSADNEARVENKVLFSLEEVLDTVKSCLRYTADIMKEEIEKQPDKTPNDEDHNMKSDTIQNENNEKQNSSKQQSSCKIDKRGASSENEKTQSLDHDSFMFKMFMLPFNLCGTIIGAQSNESGLFAYISYDIDTKIIFPKSTTQYRFSHKYRYRDFDTINETLKKHYPEVALPQLPAKDTFSHESHFSQDFVQKRKVSLQLWLNHVTAHPILRTSIYLIRFLCGNQIPEDVTQLLHSTQKNQQQATAKLFGNENDQQNMEPNDEEWHDSGSTSQNFSQRESFTAHSMLQESFINPHIMPMKVTSNQMSNENAANIAAKQQLHMMKKELKIIHPLFETAQKNTKNLHDAYTGCASVVNSLIVASQNVHSIIPEERKMWEILETGLKKSHIDTLSQITQHIDSELFQALKFWNVSFLNHFKSAISVIGKKPTEFYLQDASNLIFEWKVSSTTRGNILFQYLLQTVRTMQEINRQTAETWIDLKQELEAIPTNNPHTTDFTTGLQEALRSELKNFSNGTVEPTEPVPNVEHMQENRASIPSGLRRLPLKFIWGFKSLFGKSSPETDETMYNNYSSRPNNETNERIYNENDDYYPPYDDEYSDEDDKYFNNEDIGFRDSEIFPNENSEFRSSFDNSYDAHDISNQQQQKPKKTQSTSTNTPMNSYLKNQREAIKREQEKTSKQERDKAKEQAQRTKLAADDIAERRQRQRTRPGKHIGQGKLRQRKLQTQGGTTSVDDTYVNSMSQNQDESTTFDDQSYSATVNQQKWHSTTETKNNNFPQNHNQQPIHQHNPDRNQSESTPFSSERKSWQTTFQKNQQENEQNHDNSFNQRHTFGQTNVNTQSPQFNKQRSQSNFSSATTQQQNNTPQSDRQQNEISQSNRQHNNVPQSNQQQNEHDNTPLPSGWEEVTTSDGRKYFYHRVTRVARWEKPTAEVAAKVEERILSQQHAIDDAINRRKLQKEAEQKQKMEQEQHTVVLSKTISQKITQWEQNRPIDSLLKNLHEIYPSIPKLDISNSPTLNEIKRAYMQVVRVIHPDKLSNPTLEQQLLCQSLFTLLTTRFEAFKTTHSS